MVRLQQGPFGTYMLVNEDGRSCLVQQDWDFPGIASHFGWAPCEAHEGDCQCVQTDGTVECPECGTGPADYIDSARVYLAEVLGEETDDPGWFVD